MSATYSSAQSRSGQSAYPVDVVFGTTGSASRFWAIPALGYLIKYLILIPHFVVAGILALVVGVLQYVLWIPVLFTGQYPEWGFSLVAGTMRWWVRIYAYFFGLTDRYPPFGPGADAGGSAPYPITVQFDRQEHCSRFWAIPILGYLIKSLILIPHVVVLWVLGAVVGLVQLVLWIPVLFGGQYPEWGYQLVGGYLRWSVRVAAYYLGLADRYPPFELG